MEHQLSIFAVENKKITVKMETNDKSTISVTGTGSVHVVPDVTRLEIEVRRVFKTYQEAYACVQANSTSMVEILEYNKQPGKLVKTIYLDISDNLINEYSGKNYIGKKKEGYLVDQKMKVDLGMDNVLVNKIVKGVGKFIPEAQINIGYTQKDPRPTQLKMLERAVSDARDKAGIMAKVLGRELGDVKNIEYGEMHISIFSEARTIYNSQEATACTPNSLDITPDDLAVTDNVNVEWWLK